MLLALPLLVLAPAQSIHCTAEPLPVDTQTPIWISGPLSPFTSTWLELGENLAVLPGAPHSGFERSLVTFERVPNTENWVLRGALETHIPPPVFNNTFAAAFDLEGTELLVTEPGYYTPSFVFRGRIISYEWDAGLSQWGLPETILAPFGGPRAFGASMARSQDWMAATIGSSHPQLGHVLLLYKRDSVTGTWDYHSRIDPAFGGFVGHVAMHGDLLAAKNGNETYVFRRDSSDQWVSEGQLETGSLPGFYMRGMRIFDDEILVDANIAQGNASVFTFKLGASSGTWDPSQDLNGSLFPPFVGTGGSANFDVDEDTLLIAQGEYGSDGRGRVLRFKADPVTGDWIPDGVLDRGLDSLDYERFGSRVALHGNRALVASANILITSHSAWALNLDPTDCNGNQIADVCEVQDPLNDRNADGVVDACQQVGSVYCQPSNSNSSGTAGRIGGLGSDVISDASLVICADRLPLNEFGYLLASSAAGFIPNVGGSSGNLCLGGGASFGRFTSQIGSSGSAGVSCVSINLSSIPTATGPHALAPGETWYFQYWHRDGLTSNHTPGLAVLFQ